jgi:hypothetical protein
VRALGLIVVLAGAAALAPTRGLGQQPRPAQAAARRFESGQKLYREGRYQEAIKEFEEAHRLAPHASALYNVGRCHESLGNSAQAVDHYERAQKAPGVDAALLADLAQRIARLRAQPTRVFVSSDPPGARVTVDGARAPEAGATPLVLKLRPGEHVLILSREGYRLETKRVEVELGKELPVQVTLAPLPKPCPPPPPPCPPEKRCPSCALISFERLHVHLGMMGAFGLTPGRSLAAGPGALALISVKRWVFGGHFAIFPWQEMKITPKKVDNVNLDRIWPRWAMAQIEGGRAFVFPSFFLYATLGLGVSIDRVAYVAEQSTDATLVREYGAFVWSLGGGIQALATRWLSLGAMVRFGVAHGKRVDQENPDKGGFESGSFPYGTISGTLAFHL